MRDALTAEHRDPVRRADEVLREQRLTSVAQGWKPGARAALRRQYQRFYSLQRMITGWLTHPGRDPPPAGAETGGAIPPRHEAQPFGTGNLACHHVLQTPRNYGLTDVQPIPACEWPSLCATRPGLATVVQSAGEPSRERVGPGKVDMVPKARPQPLLLAVTG